MSCRRVQHLLSDYHEGLLKGEERAGIEAHLKECLDCRGHRNRLVAFEAKLRDVAEWHPAARPDFQQGVAERWIAERAAPQGSSLRFSSSSRVPPARLALLGAAAVSLIVAVLGASRWMHGRIPQPAPLQAPTPGQERSVTARSSVAHTGMDDSGIRLARSHAGFHAPAIPNMIASGVSRTGRTATRKQGAPSHPASLGQHAPDGDDLSILNGEPRRLRRWAPLRVDGQNDLEARVRRSAPIRDDFVQIAFPRLASTADRSIAEASESYKREAAVVDARLAREVTLQQKATALSDLCDRLRADTGIQLAPGSSVADEKVTLFCEKRPLREIMRQLSRPFGYIWLRSGKAGEYRYELVQDLRSQLMEEELRNRDRNAALLALHEEMERYRPYLHLSPDEALSASKTATPEEKPRLERLAGLKWGAIQMYFRLSPDDFAALRAGRRLEFAQQPRGPEDRTLPLEIARGVLQSHRDLRLRDASDSVDRPKFGDAQSLPDGLPPSSYPRARARMRLDLGQSELGQYTMEGDCMVSVGTWDDGSGGELANGLSPSVRNPENAFHNRRWNRDPALRARVSLTPQPSHRVAPGAGASPPSAEVKVTSADVLEALHSACGLPVVADYYTRLYPARQVSVRNSSLFDALNRLSDTMRLHWSREKEGNWLQFRSVSFYDDRVKEVPNRLLFRWSTARRQQGALTLDDLCEIARLTDVQLDSSTMAEGARVCFDLQEWELVRTHNRRRHLRYLAELTPDQRRKTMYGEGLPVSQLSLSQQQKLVALLGERLPSLDALSSMTIRVEYLQPGEFQWVQPGLSEYLGPNRPWPANFFGLPTVRDRTPEAVLQAARRIDPNVDPAQIRPTELWLAVIYRRWDPQSGRRVEWGTSGAATGNRINW